MVDLDRPERLPLPAGYRLDPILLRVEPGGPRHRDPGLQGRGEGLLPAMLVLDAFFLSHTSEPVEIPEQGLVDRYLPPYRPKYKLDLADPRAFGGITMPSEYFELRYKIQKAMEEALAVAEEADLEFKRLFGRGYGLVEPYRLEGAELALVTSGTVTSTARLVIDRLRAEGERVGLLKVRLFRPFPTSLVREHLLGIPKIAVIDRNISFGHGGIFAQEIKSALYNHGQPPLFGFIAGLGGRDITPELIEEIITYALSHDRPEEEIIWMGVKR
jgi:pyruvate/2-oxoacid:ferredoxin oxidoreductase alpha subunit